MNSMGNREWLDVQMQTGLRWLSQRKSALLLGAILLLAFVLRIRGIAFDLPNLYHPDEDAVVMPALTILKTGDWRPTRLEYGSLHIYLLTVVSALSFVLLARNGRIPTDTTALPIYERGSYPAVYAFPEFFIAARLVSVLMGTAAIFLIYLLGKRLGGNRLGLLAAGITAVLPYHVADAHFATTDTPLFFWITLALFLMVRTYDNWEHDNAWSYVGAGFVAGLATSTKYNGIVLMLPLVLIPLLRGRSLEDAVRMRTAAGPLAMAAGFVAGTPYALLDLPHFLSWFGYSLRLYNAPVTRVTAAWRWHLDYHLGAPHAPIFLLGIAGFLLSWRVWGRRGLLLNSFALALLLAVLNQTNYQARMWQPASMVVILWAALTVTSFVTWLEKRLHGTARQRVIGALPYVVLVPLLVVSWQYGRRFQMGDVRSAAAQWIRENVPHGTPIAGDYFMPNVDPAVWPVTKSFNAFETDLDTYRQDGVRYIVLLDPSFAKSAMTAEQVVQYEAFIDQACFVDSVRGPFLATTTFDMLIYAPPPCSGTLSEEP